MTNSTSDIVFHLKHVKCRSLVLKKTYHAHLHFRALFWVRICIHALMLKIHIGFLLLSVAAALYLPLS